MANFPDRCQHLKINGTQCGSPALRRNRFCYFHKRFQDERIRLVADRKRRGSATFVLPVLEDANSIQIALMQVMRMLVTQQMDHKTASLLLYALQTASVNLRRTDFKPHRHEVILDPRDAAEAQLGAHNLWEDDDFDTEEDEEEQAEPEKAFDPDEYIREKQMRRQQERERKDGETIAYYKEWSKTHSGCKLIRDNGRLRIVPVSHDSPSILPEPENLPAKKPPSSMTAPEIRADIVDIRKSGIPEMHAAKLAAEKEKQAT